MASRSASVVNGGIIFGNLAVEPTRRVCSETASFSAASMAPLGAAEVQSVLSSPSQAPQTPSMDFQLAADALQRGCLDHLDVQCEAADVSEEETVLFNHKRHYFILSSAGKPIYSLHGSQDLLIVYSGIIQTIISFYEFGGDSNEDSESIQSIESRDQQGNPILFTFLNKSPIFLMSISLDPQSTSMELHLELDFLYNFLLATLSKPFIDKTFSKRANFDLRQVLGSTDIATLDSICTGLANGTILSQVFGGLECLKIRQSTRSRLESKMLKFKCENMLYALVVGPNGKLIDIMRPKRHTLHTSDLAILFDIIYNTNAFKSAKEESNDKQRLTTNETYWLPLCLPKFNPTGHLYALIQFHQINDPRLFDLHDVPNSGLASGDEDDDEDDDDDNSKIGIIVITPYRDAFEEMKSIATGIAKSILFDKTIWYDIWKGLIGNNRIVFEEVIKSYRQKQIQKKRSSMKPNDNLANQRRGTLNSIKTFFNPIPSAIIDQASQMPNANVALRVVSSRESILSLQLQDIETQTGPVHFVIKNKRLTQFIYPYSYSFNVQDEQVKMKLSRFYKQLRHAMTEDASIPLRVIEWKTNSKVSVNDDHTGYDNTGSDVDSGEQQDTEQMGVWSGLGAIINGYEVYVIYRGKLNPHEGLDLAITLVKWAKKEDGRLFISAGGVF